MADSWGHTYREVVREYGPPEDKPSLFVFGRDEYVKSETRGNEDVKNEFFHEYEQPRRPSLPHFVPSHAPPPAPPLPDWKSQNLRKPDDTNTHLARPVQVHTNLSPKSPQNSKNVTPKSALNSPKYQYFTTRSNQKFEEFDNYRDWIHKKKTTEIEQTREVRWHEHELKGTSEIDQVPDCIETNRPITPPCSNPGETTQRYKHVVVETNRCESKIPSPCKKTEETMQGCKHVLKPSENLTLIDRHHNVLDELKNRSNKKETETERWVKTQKVTKQETEDLDTGMDRLDNNHTMRWINGLPKNSSGYKNRSKSASPYVAARSKVTGGNLSEIEKLLQTLLEKIRPKDELYTNLAYLIMKAEAYWYAAKIDSDHRRCIQNYRKALQYYSELFEKSQEFLQPDDRSVQTIVEKITQILIESGCDDSKVLGYCQKAVYQAERGGKTHF